MNRIDPMLFARCFEAWVAEIWPKRHEVIATDGRTARRTHDRKRDVKALHTLGAYATTARLTLAQLCAPEKTDEIAAIPVLLDTLAEAGHLNSMRIDPDSLPGRRHRAGAMLAKLCREE